MPHLQVGGVGRFTAKGSGTLEQPIINAHVQLSDLVLNGDHIGDLTADAVTRGQSSCSSRRDRISPQHSLAVDGGIELRGDMPSDLKLEFSGLDIDPFLPAQTSPTDHPPCVAGRARGTDRPA